MSYVVLKPTFAGGARRSAGDVIDLDRVEAENLIAMGRIGKAAPSTKADTADRSVGLSTSTSAAPKTRKRKVKNAD